MSDKTYAISKTSFIKFEQCHKAFFLYKNHPYLRDKLSVDKQLTFRRGHDVGNLAQQLFPGGTDVSKETKNFNQALELTERLIKERCPVIYEATFLYNGVLIMIDILCLDSDKYFAYEIKSSLKISEVYLKDAYLQYYVIKHVVPQLEDLFLVSLNGEYKLTGALDTRKLFKRRSVKAKAEENTAYFEHRIQQAHQILEQNLIPNIAIGKHCFRPYQCDYFGTCWKDTLNDRSIFNIPLVDKGTLFDWYNSGIRNMDELTNELAEKQNLQNIKNAIIENRPIINKSAIRQFIKNLSQPQVAMDMEIWNPAIPELEGTGPFEQIPFLVCFYDGKHFSHYFTGHTVDEREAFTIQLLQLSEAYPSILVYDKTMEVAVIDALIKNYPQYKTGLEALKRKLHDIFDVFLNIQYYDPVFKNNFTLKGVSSVLVKDISYSSINSGLEAMSYFARYRQAEDLAEKQQLKQDLVDYCNTDCLATFGLARFLETIC